MSISPEDKARFEAAGHQAALSHVETLADQKVPLSQVELLEVHRLIFAQSWPEIAGRNGRVARLVLNCVFRYFELPYVTIPREERDRYLDALEAANRGDMAPFTDFVAEQYEHSLDQVLDQTSDPVPEADE